jgi:hypothetical protein
VAAAQLFAQPYWQAYDNRLTSDTPGVPLVGAKLTVFITGSTTPQPVYHDSDLSVAWTQPIVTNASGISDDPIYVSQTPALKIVAVDADDVALPGFPQDPWSPYALGS